MATPPPPPKRPGLVKYQVIRALDDYTAAQPDELTVQEGETIYVMDKSAERWKCKVGDKEGYLPANYFDTDSESIDHPLHEAAKRSNIGFLSELLSAGLSVNTLDHAGNSALYWAVRGGHLDCVKLLLQYHPVVTQQNKMGDTILHGAAWGGHHQVIEHLLTIPDVPSLLTVRNHRGQTPFELAKNVESGALLQPRQVYAAPVDEYEDSDQES